MKKKSIKRFVWAAMSALCVCACTILSACGASQPKIKITIGMWQGSSVYDTDFYEEQIAAFEQAYPQYEIESSPYVYDSETAVAKFASGQLPTLFEVDASRVRDAYRNGHIQDIASYLQSYGWLDKVDDFFLDEISDGARVYGVPAEQYALGMVLNLPLLCSAGIIEQDEQGEYILYDDLGEPLYPDTFAEILAASETIVDHSSKKIYSAMFPSGDADSGKLFLDIAYNFGCGALEQCDAEGNWSLVLDTDEFGDAMRWVRSMSQEGYADDSKAYGVEDWAADMAQNAIAFAFCQSNRLSTALAAEPSLNGNIAFVPMPVAEGEESSSAWNGTVFAVNSRADREQTEGAFLFLQFMGYGPDTDEHSFSVLEYGFSERNRQGDPVFPVLSVWQDAAYEEKLQEIYLQYANVNATYIREFYRGFDGRRRASEPYACTELYLLMDSLFDNMLFNATTSNIVTLIEEGERGFTERYLSRIGAEG